MNSVCDHLLRIIAQCCRCLRVPLLRRVNRCLLIKVSTNITFSSFTVGRFSPLSRKLATQACDPASRYQHSELGYRYRMSNLLAAMGWGQPQALDGFVKARRRNFAYYQRHLGDLPGVAFMPEAPWGRHTRWLTVLTIDPAAFGASREDVRLALEAENIESRPVWKPMYLQPLFAECEAVGGCVAEEFFANGLCLPAGSALTEAELDRVIEIVRGCARR